MKFGNNVFIFITYFLLILSNFLFLILAIFFSAILLLATLLAPGAVQAQQEDGKDKGQDVKLGFPELDIAAISAFIPWYLDGSKAVIDGITSLVKKSKNEA